MFKTFVSLLSGHASYLKKQQRLGSIFTPFYVRYTT